MNVYIKVRLYIFVINNGKNFLSTILKNFVEYTDHTIQTSEWNFWRVVIFFLLFEIYVF